MNWSRDKNSSEEKAVNGEIYCMLSFGGGSLNNELESWQELFRKRKLCIEKYNCMLGLGGKFKQ